jgi:predicted transcriptional regulator
MKSSYQKLKDRISELEKQKASLRSDIKKIINKDFEAMTYWSIMFKMEEEFEKCIWNGNTTHNEKTNTKLSN